MSIETQQVHDPIGRVLERHREPHRDQLIPILQEVQEDLGFLSREAVIRIAGHLRLPASKVYGVATFYNQFRFQAPGRFQIQICRGTACHVKNSLAVLEALRRQLKVDPGQTTRDGLFSLEVVACIGACGLAPVLAINGEFYGGVTPEAVPGILESYRAQAAPAETAGGAAHV
jgi:NADH:ubiquinone oxidoreductase subunit E